VDRPRNPQHTGAAQIFSDREEAHATFTAIDVFSAPHGRDTVPSLEDCSRLAPLNPY
jgi:hypothetical protein